MDAASQRCPRTYAVGIEWRTLYDRHGGILTSQQVSDGTLGKVGRLEGALDNYWSSPVAAGDRIFFAAESGKIVVIKAGLDWQILAVNDLDEQCYAPPRFPQARL